MQIHQLEKSKGLKDKQRRRGRGNATGTGNYSSRGLKGQKSRSGHSMKPFFEGWQTSIVQRLPKARGFTRYFKLIKDVTIINLGVLDADVRISDAMEITKQLLKDLWYIKSAKAFVKLLWHGDYAKHLTFKDIDAFSASAKAKMEKPWTVHSISKKTPVKIVKDPKSKVGKLKSKSTAEKKIAKKIVTSVEKVEVKKAVPVKAEKLIETPVEKVEVKKSSKEDKPVAKKAPAVKKLSKEDKPVEKKTSAVKKSSKEDKSAVKKTK